MNDLQARILIYAKDGINLKPIKIYKDKHGKNWVEAKNNTKFVIEVKNNTFEEILSVISIDGISILTGKQAVLEPKNGYVLSPYSSTKINGWRTSLTDVREFVFTSDKNESYSHKLGANENNTGVIGFAFYKSQKEIYNLTWPIGSSWTSNEYKTSGANTYTPTSFSCCTTSLNSESNYTSESKKMFKMATKQGEKVNDEAIQVNKKFEDTPFIIDTIYYDSRENLIAKGIIKEEREGLPQPFASTGFCPSL